jgi:hypothetical protein
MVSTIMFPECWILDRIYSSTIYKEPSLFLLLVEKQINKFEIQRTSLNMKITVCSGKWRRIDW